MDPVLLKQMIEQDSPELAPMLAELSETMTTIETTIKPVLEKLKSTALRKNSFLRSKNGRSYLQMKHNLLLSYSTFLIFYLLLKVEGREIKNHPVVYKLAHIKTLLQKLKPVDDKIKVEVERILAINENEVQSDSVSQESQNADSKSDEASSNEPAAQDSQEDDEEDFEGLDMQSNDDDEELGDDLTPEELKELQNVIKMNHAKQKEKQEAPTNAAMSASEMKRQQKVQKKEMKNKLAKFDDFGDAVVASKAKSS